MIQRHLPKDEAEKTDFKWRMSVGKRLVDGLIEAGTLVADGNEGNFRFVGNRQAPDTAEARAANFSGALKKLAEKTVKTPEAQQKLLQFLIDARNLYGFHFIETTEGRAVMFPSSFAFDEKGFRLSAATALISTQRGLEIWGISDDKSFQVFLEEGRPKFRVSLDGAARDDAKTSDFQTTVLLPHAGKSDFSKTINDVSKQMSSSVKCLAGKRELVSGIVGEDIETTKWLGFVQSFYKVRPFFASIRGVVFSILDVDVRKRAGRARKATYEHYNWFFKGSQEIKERKLQASDAFPLFTGEFMTEPLDSTITLGLPLLPVIADQFGLSVPQARQLRGLHWQRLGSSIHQYEDFFKKGNRMFAGVPPEKIPKTKKEWKQAANLVDLYGGDTVSALSDAMIARLNRNVFDNFDKLPEQLDIDSVMNDIAKALFPLSTGQYSPHFTPSARDRAAFVGAIVGGNFGSKRLKSLSEDWHRLAPLRTGAIRLMLRKVHNIPLAIWEPLTENFECEHGTLTWLTNEGELISEGLRMRHCVGSYIDRCVQGITNIATICSKDGNFSTAEIRLDGADSKTGKQYVVQHRSYKNGNPADKCEQVLAAYLKKHRKEKLTAKGGTAAGQPPHMVVPLCDTMRKSLMEAYKDCVPAKVFAMSRSDWEEAYRIYARDDGTCLLPQPKMQAYPAF
ncbi:PcfJ domain-containing protein [Rhizobium sp. MHM7A]|uniref:PcfJ domain-containing protein n=1 Tax=Rhizobium sp. MHM7A TaxID=2583233 RepID=UPI0014874932|nr:PcfJ domain-containing protein [Rhizobium sp. MHM7A]